MPISIEFSQSHLVPEYPTGLHRLSTIEETGDDKPAVYWTEVKGTVHRPGLGGAVCGEEAKAIVDELESLLISGIFAGTVGVVTPFRAQANRIRDLVTERLDISTIERSELIVDTAHYFQGDERDVIIFSPCIAREMPRGAKYFLSSTGNCLMSLLPSPRPPAHNGGQSACGTCGISFVESFANYVAILGGEGRPDERKKTTSWNDPRVGHWERPFYEALVKAGLKQCTSTLLISTGWILQLFMKVFV